MEGLDFRSDFAQPPRHLHRNDQQEQLTHWVTGAVAWNATDRP
jgi:hypothetical protein